MPPYSRILVPRDFSAASERALETAVDLAGRTGASLHLLHADVLHGDPTSAREAASEAMSLDTVRERYSLVSRGDGTVTIEEHAVRDLAAAPAIVHFAEQNDIDLIVMGTHGRRGVRRFLVGSVTEEVVRIAPSDVLIQRSDSPRLADRPVLVPVDFSDQSRHALQRGREMAGLYGGRLHVMHSAHVAPYPAFYGSEVQSVADFPPGFDDDAMRALRSFESEGPGSDIPAVDIAVEVGQPFRRIVEYAASKEIGLIVMGRRGLSAIERALIGSTTERTLRIAPCAVLVTRFHEDA